MNRETSKAFNFLKQKKFNEFSNNGEQHSSYVELNPRGMAKIKDELLSRSNFLKAINMFSIVGTNGEKALGVSPQQVTGRKPNERHVANYGPSSQSFDLIETDSCCSVSWQYLDAIHSEQRSDLEYRLDDQFYTQIASDMIKAGWNGESIATTTQQRDLSDLNKGWLQQLREQNPSQFKNEGKQGDVIKIFGAKADYKNLNELAYSLLKMLGEQHQQRNDLVFLVGSDLLAKEPSSILGTYNDGMLGNSYIANRFGGLQTLTPPNFPSCGAVVTTLNNLSIYTSQLGALYSMKSDEENMRIISRYYRHEAYIVEDLSLMSAIDPKRVQLGD